MVEDGQPIVYGDIGEQVYLEVREGDIPAPLAVDFQSAALVLVQPEIDRAMGKTSTSATVCPNPGKAHEIPAMHTIT